MEKSDNRKQDRVIFIALLVIFLICKGISYLTGINVYDIMLMISLPSFLLMVINAPNVKSWFRKKFIK
jgi:hypothetical protein